jgi:cell wall-associated NlpC family hydrolase
MVIMGSLALRGAAKGRGFDKVYGDLGDVVTAVVTGDWAAMSEVLARGADPLPVRGTSVTDETSTALLRTAENGPQSAGPSDALLLSTAHRLGDGKRYVRGTTGPDSYDCSGLVWAAAKAAGLYSGPRFTSASWPLVAAAVATKVSSPQVGDVVLWPGHMGIVDGDGTFFSALNPSRGIATTRMEFITSQKKANPAFYRFHAKS